MNSQDFCYWLQGALELGHADYFDANDIRIIQDHLNLVFKKETPDRSITIQDMAREFKPIKPFDSQPSPTLFGPAPPVLTC